MIKPREIEREREMEKGVTTATIFNLLLVWHLHKSNILPYSQRHILVLKYGMVIRQINQKQLMPWMVWGSLKSTGSYASMQNLNYVPA